LFSLEEKPGAPAALQRPLTAGRQAPGDFILARRKQP
jgi:hypothetical protein